MGILFFKALTLLIIVFDKQSLIDKIGKQTNCPALVIKTLWSF